MYIIPPKAVAKMLQTSQRKPAYSCSNILLYGVIKLKLNYFVMGGSLPRRSSSLRNLKSASNNSYITSLTDVKAV